MSELIYIDTCVFLDFLFNRKDKLRPLGDIAFELLRRSVLCEFKIVISDLLITELKFNSTEKQLEDLLEWLKPKIVFIESRLNERNMSKTNDDLHYLLAFQSNAKHLVTRNIKDFPSGKLLVKLPEQI